MSRPIQNLCPLEINSKYDSESILVEADAREERLRDHSKAFDVKKPKDITKNVVNPGLVVPQGSNYSTKPRSRQIAGIDGEYRKRVRVKEWGWGGGG